jgi:hypothetical protein
VVRKITFRAVDARTRNVDFVETGFTDQTDFTFVGFEVFTAVVMKSIIFWDVTPCSLLSCNRRIGGTYRLHLQGRRNNFSKNQQASRWQACFLVLAEIISSTLEMEAICSSETSVESQQTTRRHIPEYDTLRILLLFAILQPRMVY